MRTKYAVPAAGEVFPTKYAVPAAGEVFPDSELSERDEVIHWDGMTRSMEGVYESHYS